MVFKIGNTDFSQYVQYSTYGIYSTDRYKSTVSGKGIEKRKYYERGILAGKCDLIFTRASELTAFANAIANNTSGERATAGRVWVTITAGNTNVNRSTSLFIQTTVKKREKINNDREYIRITCEVKE